MTSKDRCAWCKGRTSEPLETVHCGNEQVLVHKSHRRELERFCREIDASQWWVLGIIGTSVVLAIIGAALAMSGWKLTGAFMFGVSTAICGITLLRFPFATPETIALFGVNRSIILARIGAVAVLALALAVAFSIAQ